MTQRFVLKVATGFFTITAMACGNDGGMPEHDRAAMDAMDRVTTTTADTGGGAEMEMLGGGHASLVHEGAGGSPHVSVHWAINDGNITISYGRPYLKDRVVGESIPPMADAVWRLGADEATTLTTDTDLMLRDAHVPAGEYTLWTTYMNDEFHLIVNTETGQWGTAYNAEHDFAHVAMDVGALDTPAEQLVISIADDRLGFDWGTMTAAVPMVVH